MKHHNKEIKLTDQSILIDNVKFNTTAQDTLVNIDNKVHVNINTLLKFAEKIKRQNKFSAHKHLLELISRQFNVHVEVDYLHYKNDEEFYGQSPRGKKIIAECSCSAFRDKLTAKNYPDSFIAQGNSYCSIKDAQKYSKARALEIALTRLYRELSNNLPRSERVKWSSKMN